VQTRPWVFAVAAAFVVLGFQRPARALVRHTVDEQELGSVRAASPAAADAYEAAEVRLRAGDLSGAEKLLATARALSPQSFLLARRECQVLTELGKRDAALTACKVALSGGTAMDGRALVGALMSGSALARPKDVADAVHEAVNARRLVGQPFSDAAFCEIAYHIGDDAMFSACLSNLEQKAPGYFETARWKAARRGAPVWLYWLGWVCLGALALGTLGHAFLRWFRAPAPRVNKVGSAALLVLSLGVGLARSAQAAPEPAGSAEPKMVEVPMKHFQLSRFPINYDNPESQIPTVAERNENPLEFGYFLQDLSAEAFKAERRSDYRQAVKFWRASAIAVPDEAVAFSHACQVYEILQERDNALEFCGHALNLHGARAADFLRFSELMVEKPGPLTDTEIRDMEAATSHLQQQPDAAGPAAVIECQLGVKLEDEKRLAHCTFVLSKTAPDDPHTLTFQWSLAMKRHNYSEARRLLSVMGKTPMLPAALAQLQTATDKEGAWWRRPFVDPRYGLGLVGLIGVAGVLLFRKRAQLRDAPPGATPAS